MIRHADALMLGALVITGLLYILDIIGAVVATVVLIEIITFATLLALHLIVTHTHPAPDPAAEIAAELRARDKAAADAAYGRHDGEGAAMTGDVGVRPKRGERGQADALLLAIILLLFGIAAFGWIDRRLDRVEDQMDYIINEQLVPRIDALQTAVPER